MILASLAATAVAQNRGKTVDVWLGTSSNPMSKGIYHCTLNTASGRLSNPELAAEIKGPGFLALHPQGTHLYAVGALQGKGVVAAYAMKQQGKKSSLEFVNAVEIGDGGGTHLAIDATGKTLVTAQYGGGSVAVFSLNKDGSLNERTQIIEHTGGTKAFERRQDGPHPHWVGFSPDNRFVFVPDLGLDRVKIYRVDVDKSHLQPHGEGVVPPGSGPRHMKFGVDGKHVYVLNELTLTVTVFDYDADAGTMKPKQTIAAVPANELEREIFKSASEIRVHPGGKYLYSANRGHDTITAYAIDPESGELSVIKRENVRGATPRNFNISPDGQWVLAAGQDSHTLASFSVNQSNGELIYNHNVVQVPAPICVLFSGK